MFYIFTFSLHNHYNRLELEIQKQYFFDEVYREFLNLNGKTKFKQCICNLLNFLSTCYFKEFIF